MLQKLSAKSNALNWFDIPVSDLARAKAFYENVLDIQMEVRKAGGQEMALFPRLPDTIMGTSGILSGSLLKMNGFQPGEHGPTIYLNASPSLETVLGKIEAAGGKIVMPKTAIPAGVVFQCIDTEGNRVGFHSEK